MHPNRFENSAFARLYLWTIQAKYTMGIFFVAFVIFYLFLAFVSAGPTVTLGLFTAIQMVFACFAIGLLQQAILPADKLHPSRCALWIASGLAVTLAFSLIFRWFAALPLWSFIVFILCTAVGMGGVILGYYLELRRETRQLNQKLEQFQKQS